MLDGIRTKAQSWGVKMIFGIIIIVFVFWGVSNTGGIRAGYNEIFPLQLNADVLACMRNSACYALDPLFHVIFFEQS